MRYVVTEQRMLGLWWDLNILGILNRRQPSRGVVFSRSIRCIKARGEEAVFVDVSGGLRVDRTIREAQQLQLH